MTTRRYISFRIPPRWYQLISEASKRLGVSMSSIIRLGVMRGLARLWSGPYEVVDFGWIEAQHEAMVTVRVMMPAWLLRAVEELASDMGMDRSSVLRACLFIGLELYRGRASLSMGLSDEERRFIEKMRELFGG